MKIYSRNQLGIIFIIILGILFTIYLNRTYYQTIGMNDEQEYTVVQQNCNYSPKMSSSIYIFENNKEYSVKLDNNECEKFPKFSKIKLFYNYKSDKFIYKVDDYNGKKRLKFLIFILLISFFPWSLWITKIEKKNSR